MTDRTTARVVGGLFIAATISGVLSLVLSQPVLGDDYLSQASLNETRVATGMLMTIIMTLAIVAIPIVIYPILRRFSVRLALGYIVARTIEVVVFFVGAIGVLMLMSLSKEYVGAGADVSNLQTLGGVLRDGRDGADEVIAVMAFSVSALTLNYVLYRARLVPRWLSGWGLAGAVLYLAAGVAVLYGLEPLSATQMALQAPLGVQEMVFAVWLIAKGFDTTSPPLVREPDRTPVPVSV
jgi:hypothetical protein